MSACPEPIRLDLPASRQALAALRVGDEVALYGPAFTARDATHERLAAELAHDGGLPYGLAGQALFYAGPTPPAAGRPAGAIGPTTARRMDAYTPTLLEAGIAVTIGKGARSSAVIEACREHGAVYLAAVGGAAALLARHVTELEVVAYPELGTEALARVALEGFPAFVAIDTMGRDLYAEARAEAVAGERLAADSGDTAPAGGAFITLEGGEGSGKTTQAALLAERLRAGGADVVAVREPGGTPAGEAVRELLLDRAHDGMNATAELLLYEASRAQLVADVIAPALMRGAVVVCDRFSDSTTAYQGFGRGLPLSRIRALNDAATGGLVPDLTVVVDIDPACGLRRACGQCADRLEAEDARFHGRVREGFLTLAREEPQRVVVVDGAAPVEEVSASVSRAVAAALPAVRPYLEPRR